ncbi:potassium voltage-gated channel subfamily G member 4a isoform X2 [Paramormyrops kingsleyae]|uniref:potassium voltage-gated channel subfamily G member 4a isoform X2 n=1 Tax=Paramormyrops kingsleyae TaxID=1676925 RepID=UPI000CD62F4A|nr:potassium voltage-gated channel subfamily G member 4 isoform X2 [Paramormyrops kingsleyae]
MPLISNANHDFSNLSLSDESSLDHMFTEIPETETVKGVYYKRAQLIRRPEDLSGVDHGLLAIINVGGNRYTFPWSTLEEFPLTRLGRLRLCSSLEEITQVCDDYDEVAREYFFDRSPSAFRVILNFLAAGKLRMLREMCALSLHDEFDYWGVEMAYMEHCCKRKMYTRMEELAEHQRREEERRQQGAQGECSQKCYHMFIIETACVAWFSLEFLLRFVQARSKLEFIRGPLNIIDAMAILPYYVSLVVEEDSPLDTERASGGRGYLDKLGLVLRILRALRILYVMRLARHSLGLQTLGLTMRRSIREFGLLLLFLAVAVTLFSPLVHLAESEITGTQDFSSIPASYWWAIISMTTVGYGDMVPHSIPGQVVAMSSILSGILIMAFPATSIFHMFSRSYQELKLEQKRQMKEETVSLGTTAVLNEDVDGSRSLLLSPAQPLFHDADTVFSQDCLPLVENGHEATGKNHLCLPPRAL